METPKTAEFAHIGKSVIIKGELSGSEDLYVDGQVEGSIELAGNRLIIGPHGQVRAQCECQGRDRSRQAGGKYPGQRAGGVDQIGHRW